MQRKFRMKAQQTGAAATAPGGAYRPTREGRAFRLAFISPLLYFFGSIAWLIGAALACGAFPRSLVVSERVFHSETCTLAASGSLPLTF